MRITGPRKARRDGHKARQTRTVTGPGRQIGAIFVKKTHYGRKKAKGGEIKTKIGIDLVFSGHFCLIGFGPRCQYTVALVVILQGTQ